MPTKAELKNKKNPAKTKLRSGDKVRIIAGKDKGEEGFIAAVDPIKRQALVLKGNPEDPENLLPLNAVTKHMKARYEGQQSARFQKPSPIDLSNLMLLDPDTNKPTRVGRRVEDGKIVRYAKGSGKTVLDPSKGGDSAPAEKPKKKRTTKKKKSEEEEAE